MIGLPLPPHSAVKASTVAGLIEASNGVIDHNCRHPSLIGQISSLKKELAVPGLVGVAGDDVKDGMGGSLGRVLTVDEVTCRGRFHPRPKPEAPRVMVAKRGLDIVSRRSRYIVVVEGWVVDKDE